MRGGPFTYYHYASARVKPYLFRSRLRYANFQPSRLGSVIQGLIGDPQILRARPILRRQVSDKLLCIHKTPPTSICAASDNRIGTKRKTA